MNLQDLWIAKCLKHNKTLHICQIYFDCLLEYSVLLTISTTNGVELCVASSCHCNKVHLHEGVTGKFGHLGFKVEIITFKNASAKVGHDQTQHCTCVNVSAGYSFQLHSSSHTLRTTPASSMLVMYKVAFTPLVMSRPISFIKASRLSNIWRAREIVNIKLGHGN